MDSFSNQFRATVEGFLARTGMKTSEFGRQAARDPSFVLSLRRGRSCTLAVADRVLRFIRDQENKQ
jgi:predicted transcriptional regulator